MDLRGWRSGSAVGLYPSRPGSIPGPGFMQNDLLYILIVFCSLTIVTSLLVFCAWMANHLDSRQHERLPPASHPQKSAYAADMPWLEKVHSVVEIYPALCTDLTLDDLRDIAGDVGSPAPVSFTREGGLHERLSNHERRRAAESDPFAPQ